MLPKKRRVTTEQFKNILTKSTVHHSAHLSLRITKDMAQLSRFSVVVSKKVARSAVERNSLKRKVYTTLEGLMVHVPVGWKGIFFVKKGFGELSFLSQKQEVRFLLEKSLNISLS